MDLAIIDAAVNILGEETERVWIAQVHQLAVDQREQRLAAIGACDRHVRAETERVVAVDPDIIGLVGAAARVQSPLPATAEDQAVGAGAPLIERRLAEERSALDVLTTATFPVAFEPMAAPRLPNSGRAVIQLRASGNSRRRLRGKMEVKLSI
ncbi:hypothetical protein IVA80_06905 [Bradyrhizobium sp. 139]|uniref:hypothetical protein n=1 Tax=Bradyrhizobium sp. 139 TaxID=2782616 RepID=UPI001FF899FE|nr:hypothetical protein [Bradyrhizobium sp. 139]MCK1740605.1 hypothetical protein [Bradyrhizobium sp. 139]